MGRLRYERFDLVSAFMSPSRPRGLGWIGIASLSLCVISLVLLVVATLIFHWDKQLLLAWQEQQTDAKTRANSVWLPDYRLVYAANIALPAKDELSGLSWNPHTNTLLGVTGKTTALVEFNLQGTVLRRTYLQNISDTEAVEVLPNGLIGVVDERLRRLFLVEQNALGVESLDIDQVPSFDLGFADAANKGFEGLGWDSVYEQLVFAKERDPMALLHATLPEQSTPILLTEWISTDSLMLRDLSSVTVDLRTGHLLLLSDESQAILELDLQGKPRSFMRLWGGFSGLERGIRQAEGLTIDASGRIYVVGEPNQLYVFERIVTY